MDENDWKLSVLDIFVFSSNFFGMKMKYVKHFVKENMHGVEYLLKIWCLSNISQTSFKASNTEQKWLQHS